MTRPAEFADFLARSLPPLGLEWRRHLRRSVRRRVVARMDALRIRSFDEYEAALEASPTERAAFRACLTVTITRLWRNRGILESMVKRVFPEIDRMARGGEPRAWSAGCAGGEEAYTIALLWDGFRARGGTTKPLQVLATDIDPRCLERARAGLYGESSLREVPREVLDRHFRPEGDLHRIRDESAASVLFERHDLSSDPPPKERHLVLCRNLAFTYFDAATRVRAARILRASLVPGGFLLVGRKERLPDEARTEWEEARETPGLYRAARSAASGSGSA